MKVQEVVSPQYLVELISQIIINLSFLFRYFPFGIVFLIAGKILEMDDPTAIGKKLGFYAITVVCGLVVHGLFILPMMYFFITKKNPIVFIRGILQALLIALATSSRYMDRWYKYLSSLNPTKFCFQNGEIKLN